MTREPHTLTLEAATVIRVPPPGRSEPYALAVVRTGDGLVCGGLLGSVEVLPPAGAALAEVPTADGVRIFTAR